MKALIVDDDFTSRLILQRTLARYGETHIAVNGIEAVEAFSGAMTEGEPYDLVCLDIMMPELDGQRALKTIRSAEASAGVPINAGVKVIMTTALSDSGNVTRAFREQCEAYLVKPIDLSKLKAHLRDFGLIKAAE